MTEPRLTNDELDELASTYLDGEATPTERAQAEANPAVMERVGRFRAQSRRFAVPYAEPSAADRKSAIAAVLEGFGTEATPTVTLDATHNATAGHAGHATSISPADQQTTQLPTVETPTIEIPTSETPTGENQDGDAHYAIGAASISGLTDAVDTDDQPATAVSPTAAPSVSYPHRPASDSGDGGRGRRRWLQKFSPATAAVVALVAIVGGVGVFAALQREDDDVIATASSRAAYAEDALDASNADSSTADGVDTDTESDDAGVPLEELPVAPDDESDESMMATDAASDDASSDDMVQDEASEDMVREAPEAMVQGDGSEDMAQDEAASDFADDAMSVEERSANEENFDSSGGDSASDSSDGDFDESAGDGSDAGSATSPSNDGDAEFAFAESDSDSSFEAGGSAGSGDGGGDTTNDDDDNTDGGSTSNGGDTDDRDENGGGDTANRRVPLDRRSDYIGTFSTISSLMSEAVERGPKVDPRDLPRPLCDEVEDDLDERSPAKLVATGRIDNRDYVVFLISRNDRYDTTAATALGTCFLEIGQPYTS